MDRHAFGTCTSPRAPLDAPWLMFLVTDTSAQLVLIFQYKTLYWAPLRNSRERRSQTAAQAWMDQRIRPHPNSIGLANVTLLLCSVGICISLEYDAAIYYITIHRTFLNLITTRRSHAVPKQTIEDVCQTRMRKFAEQGRQ